MCSKVLTRRLCLLAVVAAVGWLAASCANTAYAESLWYDGFDTTSDYTVGAALHGQSGGSKGGPGPSNPFFSGAWVAQDPGDNDIVVSDSVERYVPINPSIGGSAGDTDVAACCIISRTSRLMTDPWTGFTQPDGTFYMGFWAKFGNGPVGDPHHRVIEMHDGGFDDGTQRNLMLGYSTFTGVGNTLAMMVRDNDIPVVVDPSEQETYDVLDENILFGSDPEGRRAHYFVMKFEMSTSGNDVISVFLDPVGTDEPVTPSAQLSVGNFTADRMSSIVQFTFHGVPHSAGQFDEHRVATSFAEVANILRIPEPASLSLLGLGALGLLMTVRRKRA